MDSYVLNTSNVTLSAAATKTVAQINAPATKRVRVSYVSATFNGAASAVPAKIDLMRQYDPGTSTFTASNSIDSDAPVSDSLCYKNCTVEPSSGPQLYSWYVTPNGGLFMMSFAQGEEPIIEEGGFMGLRINSPSSCSVIVNIGFIE
jgi:hypothetical protein